MLLSLPVVGLLGSGYPNKPFGGFLESKDTCEAFDFCLLAAFAICFLFFQCLLSFLYFSSSLVHVNSVWMATLVVETLMIAAHVFPVTAGLEVSTICLALGFFPFSISTTLASTRHVFRLLLASLRAPLVHAISLWHALLSWSNWPHRAHVSLPRDVFCPCPNVSHLKHRNGFGMYGTTDIRK